MITGRERRRKEKLKLRKEGEDAALAGRSRVAPQSYCLMDELQWLRGYDAAETNPTYDPEDVSLETDTDAEPAS